MPKVLDSSAVLALLHGEPGAEAVNGALNEGCISSVNAAEVLRVLTRAGMSFEDSLGAFMRLNLRVVNFGEGELRELVEISQRAPSLSLGDGVCLALGRSLKAEVLTADREWAKIDVGVKVRLIR